MNRLQELLIRWQEGALTSAELEELARLLDSAEAREVLVDDFFTLQTLREGLRGASIARPRSRRRIWLGAAAALVILGLGTIFFMQGPGEPIAQVRVGTEGWRPLHAGQGLKTVGAMGAATIRFPDGTRVDLGADTTIDRVDVGGSGKRVTVARGTASAVVSPQPVGQPMVFATPHGEARVLGTTLRLVVGPDEKTGLRLEVAEGKVELKNLAGKTVVVQSGHFAVAAVGVEFAPRRTAPAKAAELVRRMAPNTWLAAPDTKMMKATPDPERFPKIKGVSGARSVVSSWSGGVYDARRDRLVLWGGGTSSYYGNEIYAFRLDDLVWERVTEPTAEPALGKQVNPDGTPAGRSTYNGLAYVAHADRMFASGGAIAANAGNVGADLTWTFDFEAHRWTDMQPSGTRPQTQAMNSCAYDPTDRKVWWMDGTGLFSYELEVNRWTRHTTEGVYDRTLAVDPKRGRLVAVGQGQVLGVDLRTTPAVPKPWKTRGGEAFITRRVGLDYDPVADRLVGWAGGAVYSLDPETSEWTVHDAPGAPKPTESGIYGRWRYVPSLDAFVLVTDADENVHFYKPGR